MLIVGLILLAIGVLAFIAGLIAFVIKIYPHGSVSFEEALIPGLTISSGMVCLLIGVVLTVVAVATTH